MDRPVEIVKDVYWIGVNDRETHLFESLWPLPYGVSYNSYLITAEKVALVDTVKFTQTQNFVDKIREVIGKDRCVDYLIVNHMEPDHSGSIKALIDLYPGMKIVGNRKTAPFLKGFYGITENILIVEDGGELDLGGRTLKFFLAPMVHWPETMVTYDTKDGLLFSGDAFGGFRALDGCIFDNEIDIDSFRDEISRYYSNIVSKYSPMVQSALKKLSPLDIRAICATHGPIWRKDPKRIIDIYDRLSSQATEPSVVIIYGSMYGNTKKMAERIARTLSEEGVPSVKVFDASVTHLSFLIDEVWRSKGIVLGTPTYNTGMLPPIAQLIHFLKNANLKGRVFGLFGTYGWSGGGVKELEDYARSTGSKLVEPIVESHCSPTKEDLGRLDEMARGIAREICAGIH